MPEHPVRYVLAHTETSAALERVPGITLRFGDCGGDVETVCEVGGDAAAYFEPGSSENLSAVLSDLIGDATSARDLSRRGHAHASLFSWTKSAAATAQVYRQLV